MVEVVRADLQQLFARVLSQPLGEALVVTGASGLGEPAVRNLADHHMLELDAS